MLIFMFEKKAVAKDQSSNDQTCQLRILLRKTRLVQFHSDGYLRLQPHFIYAQSCVRRTRKLWNLGNYFRPSEIHLQVAILTAGILFKVIVLPGRLLGKHNRTRRSVTSFFAMKHAIFPKRCYSQGRLYRQADAERVDELIQDKLCQLFQNKRFTRVSKAMYGFSFN